MIASSTVFQSSKEEKIDKIRLLHDRAHEYKIKHADAWKTEEDSMKRKVRLKNLVELFNICELLRNVVQDQISLPIEQEELKRQEREILMMENNQRQTSAKKKKKANRNNGPGSITKNEDFEKLRQEAQRLYTQVPNEQKPYYPKTESDTSCGPNNSAMIFEYEGFKIQKTLYNETFEVIYSMVEIESFLFTGHSKGLLMIWDYNIGERVIKYECAVKDPITAIQYMKSSILWVSMMNGDMLLLRINGNSMTLDLLNQTQVPEPAKKIYSLSKLSDGRVCVAQDKGFTVWQMMIVQLANNLPSDNLLGLSQCNGIQASDQYRLIQQSKQSYLEDQVVSQILEYDVNQVLVSTMSCTYFLISLKTGQILRRIQGRGKYCIDLIRVPYYEQMGAKNIYCGVENEYYILLDVENEKTKILQQERAENQSPWYTGALFLRNKPECMVVAEEKKRSIRSFVVNNL